MAKFIESIETDGGIVMHANFKTIEAADLPFSGVTAGGFWYPSLTVDQYGRVVIIGNGIANVAPDTSMMQPGQLVFWFDPTHSAAYLRIVGKDASGAVVTGAIALT